MRLVVPNSKKGDIGHRDDQKWAPEADSSNGSGRDGGPHGDRLQVALRHWRLVAWSGCLVEGTARRLANGARGVPEQRQIHCSDGIAGSAMSRNTCRLMWSL